MLVGKSKCQGSMYNVVRKSEVHFQVALRIGQREVYTLSKRHTQTKCNDHTNDEQPQTRQPVSKEADRLQLTTAQSSARTNAQACRENGHTLGEIIKRCPTSKLPNSHDATGSLVQVLFGLAAEQVDVKWGRWPVIGRLRKISMPV